MILRPIKDKIIVRPDPMPEQIGAIHVPENIAEENPNYLTMTGTVLAVGPGGHQVMHEHKETRRIVWEGAKTPMLVKEGDRVCYNRYAGRQLKHPETDEILLVMHESEVLAIVPPGVGVGLPGYQEASDSGVKDLAQKDQWGNLRDWADSYEHTRTMG